MSRIFVFGATGYTGDLTARSLITRGMRPILVGRNQQRLDALARELGKVTGTGALDTATADATDPASIRQLLEPGDVLISTVGPFLKFGRPAVQAAAEVGTHYLDSTGEGPFIREVFEKWGPIAKRNGSALLTAFGYDFVPGALAGALALESAGNQATGLDIAYFSPGFTPSGGSQASVVRVALDESFSFSEGRIQPQRPGKHTKRFDIDGTTNLGASVPAAEHFGLPQTYPQLREINVLLGFPQSAARFLAFGSRLVGPLGKIGVVNRGITSLADRAAKGSTGGPDATERAKATTVVFADARSGDRQLTRIELRGPNPYEVTGDLLAWGAMQIDAGGLKDTGALGPISAFGLDAIQDACREAGMSW
ncbi:MAG: saccharopine dehydrogenase NADP-binding domain-containing protein [Actinobacteria bacterium]|nr:saccharopine dehydrogenase NADP-binding domain-containing protein [Actinomycetota bacterium]MCB9389964.1 saccharopine dehydrogenase NADP-binding domain-containing protein [Acidimicrobiia bacterium]